MPNDFPSMQGNHIILCLPFKNDTTWADCTNQTIPFGYLGDFTDDRTVLACTPDGGKLLHTPKYPFTGNIENRKANFVITETGELSGNMTTVFKGTDYFERESLLAESQKEQYKKLQNIYPISNMEIEKLALKQDKSFDPVTTENIQLRAPEYASIAGDKIYFSISPAKRRTYVPDQVTNRKNDVYINRGFTEEDEIIYTLPAGYRTAKVPLKLSLDKPFAKYSAIMEIKGNQLTYKRKFQLIDGTYDKESYQDLVDFYQDMADAEAYTVTLVKASL